MICPFCNEPAKWVPNEEIYGKRYGKSYMMWWCKKDDAYVGCHQNTQRPLGTMTNKEMRTWRRRAHAMLDPLWKGGQYDRREVYARISRHFGHTVHVGESGVEECKAIIEAIPKLFESAIPFSALASFES